MVNWDNIVAEHGPLVWRTAFRLVGNQADAADCYQEAFAAALVFSRRETIRNWPALLQKLATVHALDRLRRRLRDGARLGLWSDLDQLTAPSAEPSQVAQEREWIDWLRGTLAALPAPQAEVFSLVCISECSYQEAAEQMNIKPNHLATLLYRARVNLRERLSVSKETRKSPGVP